MNPTASIQCQNMWISNGDMLPILQNSYTLTARNRSVQQSGSNQPQSAEGEEWQVVKRMNGPGW